MQGEEDKHGDKSLPLLLLAIRSFGSTTTVLPLWGLTRQLCLVCTTSTAPPPVTASTSPRTRGYVSHMILKLTYNVAKALKTTIDKIFIFDDEK